jgi:WD repeat-containing protein 48
VLEEYNCFDAEMYADELELEEAVEFREDQRSKCARIEDSS